LGILRATFIARKRLDLALDAREHLDDKSQGRHLRVRDRAERSLDEPPDPRQGGISGVKPVRQAESRKLGTG
jgi:hypothetical protein